MAVSELDLERDLNDFLAGDVPVTDQKWQIDDEKKADWALRKIREAEAQIEQVKRFAEERIAEIEAWVERTTASEQRTIDFMTSQLELYHRKLFEENPRLKTIKLPSGELQLRKAQPQYARNDEQLAAWLKVRYPELVKVKETPDWNEAKKRFPIAGKRLVDPNTGEIVDGVEVYEPDQPSFRVKTNSD